jgi:Iron-containing redox enzyme
MTTSLVAPELQNLSSIKPRIDSEIDSLVAALPDPKDLTPEQRRGIIARYSAVLEGNFIYWMTAAYLSVQSEEARPILIDNLREEIGDCHPEMLRRFAIAAHAFPTDSDAMAVREGLTRVRLFLGRLQGAQNVLTMGFFESYIQRFMSYLADLAVAQGSTDLEYTDVHGVCDIAHSEGLLMALSAEATINPPDPAVDLFEGVNELRALIQTINGNGHATVPAAA